VRDAGTPTCLEYTLDFLLSGWTDGKVGGCIVGIRCYISRCPFHFQVYTITITRIRMHSAPFSLTLPTHACAPSQVRAHDCEKGQALWQIDNAHRGGVTALKLSHNERYIITGGADGEVRVWELRTRDLVTERNKKNEEWR